MAALPITVAVRAGVSVVGQAANGGGDSFVNTGKEVLVIYNGGSSITLTIATSQTSDGLAVADRAVTVGASARLAIGPFPRYAYGSTVNLTYSAVTSVTVGVLQVTPVGT
jgi:hypothetical protein